MTQEPTKSASIVMVCTRCRSEFPAGSVLCPHDGQTLVQGEQDQLLGTTFAERYEIMEVLGRGGMGVVYKARQKFMESFVAIKVLYEDTEANTVNLERFKREAQALAQLKHPNVLQVFDFGMTPNGHEFLITEYLEGTTLAQLIEDYTRIPIERATPIFLQACDGLAHAHSKLIVHRDLKPGNLIIIKDESGRELVKLVDFGIATMKQDTEHMQRLTKAGEMLGSPLYMSPEQCQGKPLDKRSDIYSLGCVMYETLTGMPPLMGVNSFETMTKHVQQQPLPLRGAAPDLAIPDLIDAVIMKALQKDPDKRHQSIPEFKKQLLQAAEKSNIHYQYYSAEVGYQPKPFSTGQFDITAAAHAFGGKPKEQHETTKELQKLVFDAVSLTRMHEKKAQQLSYMLAALYSLFGGVLVLITIFMTMPGPPQDPAPAYLKLQWRLAMSAADRSLQGKSYVDAISNYESAVDLGKKIGPLDDKELKALMGLFKAYKESGNEKKARETRDEIIKENLEHMEALYDSTNVDLASVTDLDGDLISSERVDPNSLDTSTVDWYSHRLVQNAKQCFANKQYKKAESWLREAIELEERAHGHSKGALAQCAQDFAAACQTNKAAKQHMQEIESLLQRAQQAEKKA